MSRQSSLYETLPIGSKQKRKLRDELIPRSRHGGFDGVKKRKVARPFVAQAPLHLVLKSKRAKSDWSLLHRKHRSRIASMIYTYGKRFKVRVYQFSNVGNHLHLLVKAEDRKQLADFLRVLAGRVAVVVTGAKRGVKKIGKFWDYLTWSRLVNWGHDFFNVRKYIKQNEDSTWKRVLKDTISREDFEFFKNGWDPGTARGT